MPKFKIIFYIFSRQKQLSFCFWMSTTDLANYGTVLSYAVDNEDNELTFTDYGGFVLSIKGSIHIKTSAYLFRSTLEH